VILTDWGRYVITYDVRDGRTTGEQDNIRQALRSVRKLFGPIVDREFGP